MEKELTLDEIFAELKKELIPANPHLSFTSKIFCEEMGLSKTVGYEILKRLEKQGKIRKIDKYYQQTKNGHNHAVPGWQWIENNN